jgi:hypothetical protein
MFGSGPGMIRLPTDSNWMQQRDMRQAADVARFISRRDDVQAPPGKKETWCTSCVTQVMEQFDDCSCHKEDGSRKWEWCRECRCAHCGGQDCACANPGDWEHKQGKTKEESTRRIEKAARDSQLAEHTGHVFGGKATESEDRPETESVADDTGETLEDFWGA